MIHLKLILFGIVTVTVVCLPVIAEPIPVILDSDLGTDVDDTWALAFLLRCPELDVKMIVGDHGNADHRASLACKLLERAGRTDIPVGIGVRSENKPDRNLQRDWVGDYSHKSYPGTVHADGVQAMIELIMKSPEPITVICIGPLTNIGEALKREPQITENARFIGMHGSVRRGYGGKDKIDPEWNVRCDVKACAAALSAGWDVTITPLDTCGTVILDGDRYKAVRESDDPIARLIMENYQAWSKRVTWTKASEYIGTKSSVLFDTVAIYLAFDQDFCKMEELGIRVDDKGFTRIDPSAKQIRVATEWKDYDAFMDMMVKRLTNHGQVGE